MPDFEFYLSHNNPCFQRDKAITNILALHTCEILFNGVIGQSNVPMYSYSYLIKRM